MGGYEPGRVQVENSALDAQGGLAFAAWRTNHFTEADANGSPPLRFYWCTCFPARNDRKSFDCNGWCQGRLSTWLYVGDDEVAFPTLASVVEFVRRAYLRGGGGDGADGTGGRRPSPLLPFDRPVLPLAPELGHEPASLIGEMLHHAAMLVKESRSCPPRSIAEIGWPALSPPDPIAAKRKIDAAAALANAAVALIYEIMRRMPDGRNLAMLVRWHDDARRLGYILAIMGLWPILGGDPWRSAISNLLKPLRGWKDPPAGLTSLDELNDDVLVCFLCSLFFGDGPGLDIPENTQRLLDWIKHGG